MRWCSTPQGDLIGTTQRGGTANHGTVFELASGSSLATPLVVFAGANGAKPTGSLVVDTQGTILGTTAKRRTAWQGDGLRPHARFVTVANASEP